MPITRQAGQVANSLGDKEAGKHPSPTKGETRRVCFAPGPLAGKYHTHDGHPNREGQVARPKRCLGLSWGHDLTPGSIKELEAHLGEENRPSLDRLKRRVGLLPLRKRPQTFLSWMIDSSSSSSSEEDSYGEHTAKRRRQSKAVASIACASTLPGCQGDQAQAGLMQSSHHQDEFSSHKAVTSSGRGSQGDLQGSKPRQTVQIRLVPPNRIRSGISFAGPMPGDGQSAPTHQLSSSLPPSIAFKRKASTQQDGRGAGYNSDALSSRQRPEPASRKNCNATGEHASPRGKRPQRKPKASSGEARPRHGLAPGARDIASSSTQQAAGGLHRVTEEGIGVQSGNADAAASDQAAAIADVDDVSRAGTTAPALQVQTSPKALLLGSGTLGRQAGLGVGKPHGTLFKVFRGESSM